MSRFFYDSVWQLFSFVLLGLITGLLFDVFRLLRVAFSTAPPIPESPFAKKIAPPHFFDRPKRSRRGKNAETVVIAAEDVLFFLISAVLFSFQTYWVNEGEIRIWGILLLFLGFVLWRLTLGKLLLFFSAQILFFEKILIYWLFYIIIKPFRAACSFAGRLLASVYRKNVAALRTKMALDRRKRYTVRECKRLLSEAESGFIQKTGVNEP